VGLRQWRQWTQLRAKGVGREYLINWRFRNASRNQLIAAAHAFPRHGRRPQRNPFYSTRAESQVYQKKTADAFTRFYKSASAIRLLSDLRAVGRQMVKDAQKHIRQGRTSSTPVGPGHAMQKLSPAYAAQKQRKHGSTEPILVASGKLFESIATEVRRRR
jgi:hypothetical protein